LFIFIILYNTTGYIYIYIYIYTLFIFIILYNTMGVCVYIYSSYL